MLTKLTNLKTFFCIVVCCTISLQLFSQGRFFEGRVVYSINEFNGAGEAKSVPVDQEEIFFAKNILLTKPVSGPFLMFENKSIYMNSELRIRYTVDNTNAIIESLGVASLIENIVPLEERKIGVEEIHGMTCDINYLKYVYRFNESNLLNITDTLSCTYYNSQEFKVSQLDIFSRMQGNRNTYYLDGRYNGIPLKITLKRQDGSMMIIESTEVKQMSVDDFIKLPDYPIRGKP